MSGEFKIEVKRVTPHMAEGWLKKNHPKNRKIDWRRVEAMAGDMLAGKWLLTHQGIAFDNDGHLIDGQHRLHAIIKADVAVQIVVAHNPSGQLDDPIDRHRVRSMGLLTGHNNKVVAACRVLKSLEAGFSYEVPMTPAEVTLTYEKFQSDFEIFAQVPHRSRLSGGVVGAIIWTLPIDRQRMIDFATKLSTGEMIKRGDPPFALRNWIERGQRAKTWDIAMATFACARSYLLGLTLQNVYVGESSYRAVTTRRRALKIPHTPAHAIVPSMSWKGGRHDQDQAAE